MYTFKESSIALQTKHTNIILNQRRTGKSKEYINTLLKRGCNAGQQKCKLCQKYDTNQRSKTRKEMRVWCKAFLDSYNLDKN